MTESENTLYFHLDLSEFMKYNFNVKESPIKIEWMCGAQTNICYNALGIKVVRRIGFKKTVPRQTNHQGSWPELKEGL